MFALANISNLFFHWSIFFQLVLSHIEIKVLKKPFFFKSSLCQSDEKIFEIKLQMISKSLVTFSLLFI